MFFGDNHCEQDLTHEREKQVFTEQSCFVSVFELNLASRVILAYVLNLKSVSFWHTKPVGLVPFQKRRRVLAVI